MLIKLIFWTTLILILHTYAIYPLLLLISDRFIKKRPLLPLSDFTPSVSVMMAVHNEEIVIRKKIETLFNSTYPVDQLEVIIGSDASNDSTDEILEELRSLYPSLKVVRFEERTGKPAVINRLAGLARGEILIISDANVLPAEDCIRKLIVSFTDSTTGLADTRLINTGISRDGVSLPESTYINIESRIKNIEGRLWGMMMGPFGGFYAVRRSSFMPNSEDVLADDFRICMNVLIKGQKAVSIMDAVVYENVTDDPGEEFRRKVRISAGNYQNLAHFAPLLKNPFKKLSFIFISHKVLRWLAPFMWIIMITANILLLNDSLFFVLLCILQLIFIILPPLDLMLRRLKINILTLRFFTHLFLMNLALIAGFFRFMTGVKSGIWAPTKRSF